MGSAAIGSAVNTKDGANNRPGPIRSASIAAGPAPSTETVDDIAITIPICGAARPNCFASSKGSRVMLHPDNATQYAVFTKRTILISGFCQIGPHCSNMLRVAFKIEVSAMVLSGAFVSFMKICVAAALAKHPPETKAKVGPRPTAPIKEPPTAGPKTVPAEKPLITGANILARFSGLLMSATAVIAPPTMKDAPIPATKRAAASSGKDPAIPQPAMPTLLSSKPRAMAPLRLYMSTKRPAGTFANSFARPKAEMV
mmetsp:Transcript_51621/g.95557  ORF Transcript_51621/g.95557 Transcript_51621/m.95557 type:complete len:256 (+) Transcript_51621:306-1073(+)